MTAEPFIHELSQDLSVPGALAAFSNEPFLILLDSTGHVRPRDARFSILTADPIETLRLDSVCFGDDPFATLRRWQQRIPQSSSSLPFCGGIAGLMSYELAAAFEVVPQPDRDDFQTPALVAGLFDWAIVWDHIAGTTQLCTLPVAGNRLSGANRRDWVLRKLNCSTPAAGSAVQADCSVERVFSGTPLSGIPHVRSTFSRDEYLVAVERVIEYIRAGDIFQANLAQQLTAAWNGTATELYQRVRKRNPAPFSGLFQAEDFAVVSASPERFLKVSNGRCVETRPIKGTRRRQQSPIADLYTSNELFTSEKDRAENVMIVDLLRNDISRVCEAGSVKVTGLCEIEIFETVQHLVSTVVGELKSGKDIWDLCEATLPGGSITGAPKIRAMEIIAELEPTVRGAYCGNLFCLGANGQFDSSILIRTFTLKNGQVQFPVGGGIVADSAPTDEYAETLHKAAGMLRTLDSIHGFS